MMSAAADRSFPLPVELVAFDLDGTPVDTAADISAAVNAMLQELGMPAHDPAMIAQWIGDGAQRLVQRALTRRLDGAGLHPDAVIATLVELPACLHPYAERHHKAQ